MDRKWTVLMVTSLGVFMGFLDTTIVNIAFPSIGRDFGGTSLSTLSWVLNGYTVLFAAALIPAGRIADRVGRKRVFLTGLVLFTVSSAICGMAPSAGWLIAARVVQGVAAAAMIPSALGLVLAEFPPAERGTAIGLWSMAGALAGAAGTPLGGIFVDLAGWRSVFLINLPFGVLALVAGRRLLVERRESVATRIPDLLGAGLLAAAVGALALGIVQTEEWGWQDVRISGLLALAALLAGAFVLRSQRHPAPVMDLGLWRVRSFAVANVATVVYAMGFFAMFLCTVLFLTQVWGYSPIQAGLAIAPGPAMGGLVGALAGRLADRWGQRVLVVPGQLIVAAGLGWLVWHLDSTPQYLTLWLPTFVVIGTGIGLTLPSLSGAAVAALQPDRLATGGAINNTARQVGAVLGVAILIAIVGQPAEGEALDAMRNGFAYSGVCALVCSGIGLALGNRAATGSVRVAPAGGTPALVTKDRAA